MPAVQQCCSSGGGVPRGGDGPPAPEEGGGTQAGAGEPPEVSPLEAGHVAKDGWGAGGGPLAVDGQQGHIVP